MFHLKIVRNYILCTQCTQLFCSGQRGWGLFTGFAFSFSSFSVSIFKKLFQVKIGLKLKIRIVSRVTMLKHNIIYKWCLEKYNKYNIICLKFSALDVDRPCSCLFRLLQNNLGNLGNLQNTFNYLRKKNNLVFSLIFDEIKQQLGYIHVLRHKEITGKQGCILWPVRKIFTLEFLKFFPVFADFFGGQKGPY